jgi:hypothetical protein
VKMRGSKVEDAGKRREGGNEGDEDEGGLLTYNVFVMTATAEEMDREMPHLMVRLQGSRREGTGVDVGRESGEGRERLKPNTIDFAQREKDEMRDLTRASEIISVTVGVRACILVPVLFIVALPRTPPPLCVLLHRCLRFEPFRFPSSCADIFIPPPLLLPFRTTQRPTPTLIPVISRAPTYAPQRRTGIPTLARYSSGTPMTSHSCPICAQQVVGSGPRTVRLITSLLTSHLFAHPTHVYHVNRPYALRRPLRLLHE